MPAAASNAKPAPRVTRRRRAALAVSGRRRSTRACCACAPCRAGCGRSSLQRALRRREASLLRRAPVVRRASCGLQRQASAAWLARRRRAALAVSGEEAQHSSLLRARRAALVVVGPCLEKALHRREASLLRRAPWCDVPAAASNAKPAPRVTRRRRAGARCLWEEAQHSSLLRARRAALVVVGYALSKGTAPARGLSPSARAVVRRASCGLQRQASAACHAAQARLRSLSLGRRRSTRACCARAPCRAGCGRLYAYEGHCAGERPLSFGARPWCDVPAAASNAKPAPLVARRTRAGARCLWGGGAALELAARARRAALVVVGSSPTKERCTARGLSPSARGRGATCQLRPPTPSQRRVARAAQARCARCLWGGDAALELAACARRAALVVVGLVLIERALHRREASLFRRAAVVRRASCGLQRQASAACHAQRRRAGARCLWEEAQHSSLLRVRAVPRWLWSAHAYEGHCTGERPLSFGARPWCDVPAAASNAKPAPRGSRGAGAPALAVSGEEAQHSSLLRARAVPRWLWSVRALERALHRREASLLRRAPWCDVPAAASNAKPAPRVARRRRAGARCLWGGGAALELAARARRAALVVVGLCAKKGTAPARGLSPSARARGATCQLRPPTPSQRRVARGAGAPALAVSGEEAQHSSLLRVRVVPRWL